MVESKVSVGGRVVIPKEIRERLKMKSGEKVEVTAKDRTVIIKPKREKNPVEELYDSVETEPEESPKEVARKWVRKKTVEDL